MIPSMNTKADVLKLIQEVTSDFRVRDYAQPDARPADGQLIDALTDLVHGAVQRVLDGTDGGLRAKIHRLHCLQRENHFIQDRLQRLERRRVTALGLRDFLLIQSNPERLNRAQGPKRMPAEGIALKGQKDLACFIDPANILWQQAGLQYPYRLTVADQCVVLAVNPWPFAKLHTTVIWDDGAKQGWESVEEFRQILRVMLTLAASLAKYVLMYNGLAGASIPALRHAHLFELEDSQRPMPCQHAAARASEAHGKADTLAVGTRFYPMPLYRFAGPDALDNAVRVAGRWHESLEDATENVIVFTENREPVIYMALRQRGLLKAPRLSGDVAALEIAGEIIMATEAEIRAVRENALSYEEIASVLRDVTPWRVFEIFAAMRAA
jgi:hypothetical protein